MSGWVPINRSDWDGDVLVRGEMSEVEAWHWLQASAAYEDTTQNVRGKIVPVPKGAVMVTLRRLATEFRWGSDKRVRTFLRKLEKAGWITFGADAAADAKRTQGGTQYRTQITICGYGENQSAGRSRDAAADAKRTQPRTLKNNHTTNNQFSSDEENNAREPRSPSEPRGFSEFWEAYAHKKGVGAARKAYAAALRKSDPQRIVDGARLYAATRDPRFIKNASTWLNGECWEDDPTTNQPKEMTNGRRPGMGAAYETRGDARAAELLARRRARSGEADGFCGDPGMDHGSAPERGGPPHEGSFRTRSVFSAGSERRGGGHAPGRLADGPFGDSDVGHFGGVSPLASREPETEADLWGYPRLVAVGGSTP